MTEARSRKPARARMRGSAATEPRIYALKWSWKKQNAFGGRGLARHDTC